MISEWCNVNLLVNDFVLLFCINKKCPLRHLSFFRGHFLACNWTILIWITPISVIMSFVLVFVLFLRILAFLNYQIIIYFFFANLFIDFKNRSKFKNQWWFWPLYAVFYNFMKKLIWTILMLMFLILNLNRTWQHIRKNHQIYLWY